MKKLTFEEWKICANCGEKQPSQCCHNIQIKDDKWGFSCTKCYLRYEIRFKLNQMAYDVATTRKAVEDIYAYLQEQRDKEKLAS